MTNLEFVEYIERCAREGAVYGGVFFHMSPNDRKRWVNGIKNSIFMAGNSPTRTSLQPCELILKQAQEWRNKTTAAVSSRMLK